MPRCLGIRGSISEVLRREGELIVEWGIPRFLHLEVSELWDWYESPPFVFAGARWHLRVWPDWGGRVDLRLRRDASGPSSVTAKVSAGLKGSGERREEECKFGKDDVCGFGALCQRGDLSERGLLPGGAITLTCHMRATGTTGLEELSESFRRLLESQRECDVVIRVRDKEFPAHRLLLQARSPVFEAMFSHDMVEKQKGVVRMEDCDPDTFRDFLEHVYTGSVDMISASNVFGLYAASDKYDMGALKRQCSEFMKSNMAVPSFCQAVTLAVKHGDRELVERATEFFCSHSRAIVQTAEWQTFLSENPTVGNELFIKLLSKHENIFGVV